MTLIVAMATEDALVVAADKRLTDERGRPVDNFTKIVPLGPVTVGTGYGGVRLLDPATSHVAFDAFELMRGFFSEEAFSLARLGLFDTFVKKRFTHYCQTCHVDPLRFGTGTLFQLAIYSRLGSGYTFFHRLFAVRPDGKLGSNQSNPSIKNSRLDYHGNDDVLNELKLGTNPRFDDLRNRDDVQRFIKKGEQQEIGSVTKEEAMTFCSWIIKASSETYSWIGKPGAPIGPTCDVAVIEADKTSFLQNYNG